MVEGWEKLSLMLRINGKNIFIKRRSFSKSGNNRRLSPIVLIDSKHTLRRNLYDNSNGAQDGGNNGNGQSPGNPGCL
jgi:hypothetical protein